MCRLIPGIFFFLNKGKKPGCVGKTRTFSSRSNKELDKMLCLKVKAQLFMIVPIKLN